MINYPTADGSIKTFVYELRLALMFHPQQDKDKVVLRALKVMRKQSRFNGTMAEQHIKAFSRAKQPYRYIAGSLEMAALMAAPRKPTLSRTAK